MCRKSRLVNFGPVSALNQPNHHDRGTGFSLVEVLVVIAISGILIGIAVPVLTGIRTRAAGTKAASNLRQLAAAQMLYAADNNQSFTPAWSPSDPQSWQLRLLPYVYPGATNGGTLRSDPKSVFNVPDAKLGPGGLTSVGISSYLSAANTNNGRYWNYRVLLTQRPSKIILLGEIEPRNNDFIQPPDQSLGGGRPGFRRENGAKALMAFCDGHVEALGTNALLSTIPQPSNPWFWW